MILIIVSAVLLALVGFIVNIIAITIMSVGVGVVELGFMLMTLNWIIAAVITWAIKDTIDDDYDIEFEDEDQNEEI